MSNASNPASRSTLQAFSYLCIVWLVLSVFVAAVFDYYNLALYLAFLLFTPLGILGALLWLSVPGGILYVTYKKLRAGQIRAAAAWMLVPVSVAVLMPVGHRAGDGLIFELHKSQYEFVVRQALAGHCSPPDGGRWPVAVEFLQCKPPVIVTFPWGGFLSGWEGIVYDAADQVAKPPALRQKAWRSSDVGQVLNDFGARQSLGGHYYFGGGSYP